MKKVYVVDDERLVLEGMRQVIDWQTHGFELVGMAQNGIEALQGIRTHCPELIFTDIRMPGMSGFDLIRQAQSIVPEAVFVIISGYNDFSYIRMAIRLKVFDYIEKPITLEKVVEVLDRCRESDFASRDFPPEDADIEANFEGILENLDDRQYQDGRRRIETARQYLDGHYGESVTLERIAEIAGLYPTYFSMLFKDVVGMNYGKYLNQVRMEAARELLKTDARLKDICVHVGMPNLRYFTEKFKQYFGLTPKQMRETLKEEKP